MPKIACPHCNQPVVLAALPTLTECPYCEKIIRPADRLPKLHSDLHKAQQALEDLEAKQNVFAKAKMAALKNRIIGLERLIAELEQAGC